MSTVQEYLDAYDRQLRTDAETPSAVAVARLGPLRLVTFAGGRGFVTYRDLGGADGAAIARWVERRFWRTTGRIPGSPASSGRRARTTARRVFTRRSSETGSCPGSRSRS